MNVSLYDLSTFFAWKAARYCSFRFSGLLLIVASCWEVLIMSAQTCLPQPPQVEAALYIIFAREDFF